MAVYFAHSPRGFIKIGFSRDVRARAIALAHEAGGPIVVLAVIPMPGERTKLRWEERDLERALHQRFRHLRVLRSEWFRPGADLLEEVFAARYMHGDAPLPLDAPRATLDDIEAELLAARIEPPPPVQDRLPNAVSWPRLKAALQPIQKAA